MIDKKKYIVKIYNEFDVKIDEQEILAENVVITNETYLFINYDEESGQYVTVAIVDRTDNRTVDVFAQE